MTPAEIPFWDAVDRLRSTDPRFRREAYGFVMLALGVTVRALPAARQRDTERRHLSGQELLRGVVNLGRQEFGVMAPTVFREWGLRSSRDLGELVFQLVQSGQLSARADDRPEDFTRGPDLLEALADGLDWTIPDVSRIVSRRTPPSSGSAGGSP